MSRTRKTPEEQLQDAKLKLQQQKNRVAALENRAKTEERKKRTRRLIEVGALTTKYFADDGVLEPGQAKQLLDKICSLDYVKDILQQAFTTSRESNVESTSATEDNAL